MLKQKYRLLVEVNDWPISTEPDKWMAEIPALPGCRAWGNTQDDALEIIADLAVDFIRDGIAERTLSPMINPVEPAESTTGYFMTLDLPKDYSVDWISPTIAELTVSV